MNRSPGRPEAFRYDPMRVKLSDAHYIYAYATIDGAADAEFFLEKLASKVGAGSRREALLRVLERLRKSPLRLHGLRDLAGIAMAFPIGTHRIQGRAANFEIH